ncbi:MAG: hypothetical protein JST89_18830 [Cyanobacteria bacterium SZAS-4]|nr:hypothetical protein [Cyanobacteria bacterium SZAS-4]
MNKILFGSMNKTQIALLIPLVASLLCATSAAISQPGKRIQPEVIGAEKDKPIILSQPVELPDFSVFPGKDNSFKGGWQFTKLPGSSAVILQFACKERPQSVFDWYRSQFDSNKWTYSNVGDSGIRATSRTGHKCDINLLSTRSGEGCRYQINFRLVDRAMHR